MEPEEWCFVVRTVINGRETFSKLAADRLEEVMKRAGEKFFDPTRPLSPPLPTAPELAPVQKRPRRR